jgi:hypothetical protein
VLQRLRLASHLKFSCFVEQGHLAGFQALLLHGFVNFVRQLPALFEQLISIGQCSKRSLGSNAFAILLLGMLGVAQAE